MFFNMEFFYLKRDYHIPTKTKKHSLIALYKKECGKSLPSITQSHIYFTERIIFQLSE